MIGRKKKIANLMETVRACIETGAYLDTWHSSLRQKERSITRSEVVYVLKTGWHEANRDVYVPYYKAWNYAVRGKTLDSRELRIIVSFDNHGMLVITAIDLG